jgi:hypothetical protein
MRLPVPFVAAWFFFLHVAAPKLQAGIIFVSQNRSVSVQEETLGGDGQFYADSTNASGFELFDESVILSGSGFATAEARQASFLSSSRVTVVGSVEAFGYYDEVLDVEYYSNATSTFRVFFDITRTATWDIRLVTYDEGSASALRNRLQGPQGAIFLSADFFFAESLVLTPGRYDLLVEAEAFGSFGDEYQGGRASYDLTFQAVPEPRYAPLMLAAVLVLVCKKRHSSSSC